MKDTLSGLCLDECPENKITWIRRIPHHGFGGHLAGVKRGERVFSGGRPHDPYVVFAEIEEASARLETTLETLGRTKG
jgi:hypothetical protein